MPNGRHSWTNSAAALFWHKHMCTYSDSLQSKGLLPLLRLICQGTFQPISSTPSVAKWLVYSRLFTVGSFSAEKGLLVFLLHKLHFKSRKSKMHCGLHSQAVQIYGSYTSYLFLCAIQCESFYPFLSQFLSPSSAVHALPQAIGTKLQRPLWGVRASDLC